jgi:hypothetical protein
MLASMFGLDSDRDESPVEIPTLAMAGSKRESEYARSTAQRPRGNGVRKP